MGPVPELLTDIEVADRLKVMKGWKKDGKFIAKSFEFETFMQGIAFIEEVAVVAEKEEHHPDIHVRYTKVTLSIQTHSLGGISGRDFALAKAIEDMIARRLSGNAARARKLG